MIRRPALPAQMFDVGFAEVFLLGLIGLIVLGPEKLPAVARTLGGLLRRARTSWYSLRRSIEAELNEADIAKPLRNAARDINETGEKIDSLVRGADSNPGKKTDTSDETGSKPADV